MKRLIPKLRILALAVALLIVTASCKQKPELSHKETTGRLKIVVSLFPVYDFARQIGADKAAVTMLLPPGVEAHSFEPTPADMSTLNKADVFIYTNPLMEPWVEKVLKGLANPGLVTVNASAGLELAEVQESGHKSRSGHEHNKDPHLWLDFEKAAAMADNILGAMVRKDPANRTFYEERATAYKAVLAGLDKQYREALASCRKKAFVNGGHAAFGYLARRYGLRYISAYGLSPDAEPSPGDLVGVIRIIRKEGLEHLFYEELLTPRTAEVLARETGVRLLPLSAGHNVSKDELSQDITFVGIMQRNLENLREGLQCR